MTWSSSRVSARARLRRFESWLPARARGEERSASAPGASLCPLDRRHRARRDASRRETRRDGRTCAPARRGSAAARLASVWKPLDPRHARNARISEPPTDLTDNGTSPQRLQQRSALLFALAGDFECVVSCAFSVFKNSSPKSKSSDLRYSPATQPKTNTHVLLKIRRNRGARAFGFARSGARARRRRR